jgi:hypothetical protein
MFQVESAEDVEQLISLKVPIDWELITREYKYSANESWPSIKIALLRFNAKLATPA